MKNRRAIEPVEAIYDQLAKKYHENRDVFDVSALFNALYNRLTVQKGALLDLGCGAGEPFARRFLEEGWAVTGVDISKEMLKLAKKNAPGIKTIHADMRTLAFNAGEFDVVIASYSLFHVPSEYHPVLLNSIHAWLRPQGKVLFTYATKEYTGSTEFNGYKEFFGESLFYSHTTPEKLDAMLKTIGFGIEYSHYHTIADETFLWVIATKP